eukprot:CAMPEP_0119497160 /NCGR_PEP_ID=MMETSP1344-20130328/20284_1 /TAXON_ID=236787 /ORGANISM="Florenciella parvula, Strain CCMP2471" /LENGTH=65 /DNA_ID=CAMNT_0007532925 /DNA_START=122 /DNA_END=319 /DNA_ORIENTATION=+
MAPELAVALKLAAALSALHVARVQPAVLGLGGPPSPTALAVPLVCDLVIARHGALLVVHLPPLSR